MRKNKRRKKRAKRLLRSFIILMLLAASIISFCLFTPFFNLTKITVSGCSQLTNDEIITASGIIYGENIFKISKKKVYENLSAIPEVSSVKMRRIPLSHIKLNITETHPAFIFKAKNGYAAVDPTGKVMYILDSVNDAEFPLILGIEAENAKISEKISVQDTIKFDIILENLTLLREKGISEEMSEIDFSDLSSIQGYLKGGAKVIFGKLTDIDYKLSVLLAILPQIDSTSGAYIDLSTPSNAFYGRVDDIPKEASSEEETANEQEGTSEAGEEIPSEPPASESPSA